MLWHKHAEPPDQRLDLLSCRGASAISASITGSISTAVFGGTFYVFAIGTDRTVKYWYTNDNTGSSTGSTVTGSQPNPTW